MMKSYISIDNGCSGTIAFMNFDGTDSQFYETPHIHEQSYTKTKKNISRINFKELFTLLNSFKNINSNIIAVLERPMVNPGRFDATISAVRALEATLICLEQLEIAHVYTDSKAWQKLMLPAGLKGSPELKSASKDIGCRIFPQHKDLIIKHGDADALLIGEWARRENI